MRRPSGFGDAFVFADGPHGSGQYWTITVGGAEGKSPKPDRGACFSTSTQGARTLSGAGRRALRFFEGGFIVTHLPWVNDLDADGKAEVIIWDSFPLKAETEAFEFGLLAWVFRVQPGFVLEIDWDLSRSIAREIAAAYRAALEKEPAEMRRGEGALWQSAATALKAFAEKSCTFKAEAAGRADTD